MRVDASKPLRVGVVIDPLETLKVSKDSGFVMMVEACARGHELFVMEAKDLFVRDNQLLAQTKQLEVKRQEPYYFAPQTKTMELKQLDVLLVRKDPPFDLGYLFLTHLLDLISNDVLVINHPDGLRRANEKLYILNFPEWIPPTLVSSQIEAIATFQKEQGAIVLKPLDLFGGQDVLCSEPGDPKLAEKVERLTQSSSRPIMVQKYLEGIQRGDKRIILIDGEPVGAVLRLPKPGEFRANLFMGGEAKPAEINERDQQICRAIAPRLVADGLFLVGLDIIDGTMTELNVTSPTCFQEIERFSGIALQSVLFDAIESHLHGTSTERN